MVNHPITPAYAAWRAECCKADIELLTQSHSHPLNLSEDIDQYALTARQLKKRDSDRAKHKKYNDAHKNQIKAYGREYYLKHKDEIMKKQRERRKQKTALRLQSESGAQENSLPK